MKFEMDLDLGDAVIIFKADGSLDAQIPDIDSANLPEHIEMAHAVVVTAKHPELRTRLIEAATAMAMRGATEAPPKPKTEP